MLNNSLNEAINQTITTVQNIFDELEIDAYLIGARARDIWFLPKRSPRVTKDITIFIQRTSSTIIMNFIQNLILNILGQGLLVEKSTIF
jgi:hypothetical protein